MNLQEHHALVVNLAADLPDSEVIETHISSIILSRDVAYKLKKPVDFGFLDYSSLSRRHHCCLEELRSNRRFAPSLYLGIVAVTGTPEVPMIEGNETVIEYAVKMRRFEESDQLDHVAQKGGLTRKKIGKIAGMIASFHRDARSVDPDTEYGEPQRVLAPMLENFDHLDELIDDEDIAGKLADLKVWTLERFEHLKPYLAARKREGFIRECHGDLHLHNMALFEKKIIMFDAIEFNPFLSHIDVISDLSFVLMDLEYRGLSHYANRLLNAYLELTGDYDGVRLLDFYKTYRAMVRTKVAALRIAQHPGDAELKRVMSEVDTHIDFALQCTKKKELFLAIAHGFSGSGKSTVAAKIAETLGAIRIRSDVERIRLFAKRRGDAPTEGIEAGIYAPEATEATYDHLAQIAGTLLNSHTGVIVDATFLKKRQRDRFARLAEDYGVRFVILDVQCGETLLRKRVAQRLAKRDDVSEADPEVLERQLGTHEALQDEERQHVLVIDTTSEVSMEHGMVAVRRTLRL